MGVKSRWGSIVLIFIFDWGSISIFVGWGCNQEWGSIWADTVLAIKIHHCDHYHILNLTRRMFFGSGKSKNHWKFNFYIQSAHSACIQLIKWHFVLTILNTFWVIYLNKWYLIWKCEYSASRIKNEIGNWHHQGLYEIRKGVIGSLWYTLYYNKF